MKRNHRRIDLHVKCPAFEVAIEFKFYSTRLHGSDGGRERRKGGPSKQNETEFAESWRSLATMCAGHVNHPHPYIVLAYQASDDERGYRTFHRSYGAMDLESLPEDCKARAIHRLDPIELKPGNRMHCVMFCLD